MAEYGYTTGTCAALAAKAAARLLLFGDGKETECLVTPSGAEIETEIASAARREGSAVCSVIKDAGGDPDVTNGLEIFAEVSRTESGIEIDGGEGVGRVTKPGLDRKPGEAAINTVPRKMIADAAGELLRQSGSGCGLRIVISAPGGRELADKTFNPRLGIEGGISILGTSGIVEPMSTRAVVETIRTELKYKRANGHKYALLVPGNYGRDYVGRSFGLDIDSAVKCGNFIGEALDIAGEIGFSGIALIGHAGKLVKLAEGIMNTHSRTADGRAEVFCAHAALSGAPIDALRKIMAAVTTDEMTAVLKEYGCLDAASKSIGERMEEHLRKRCGDTKFAFLVFSNEHGKLCEGGDRKIFEEAVKEYM